VGGIKDPHQNRSISGMRTRKTMGKNQALKPKTADPKPADIRPEPDPLPSLPSFPPIRSLKEMEMSFSVLFLKWMDLLALYFNFFLAVLGKEMRKWSRRDFAAFMWHRS